MDAKTYKTLKTIFPIAFACKNSVGMLIFTIALHFIIIPIVFGIVGAIVGFIPILWILAIILVPIASVIGIYGTVDVIFAFLVFFNAVKEAEPSDVTADNASNDAE